MAAAAAITPAPTPPPPSPAPPSANAQSAATIPDTAVLSGVLAWTGTGNWGVVASNIALWCITVMSVVYFFAGLLLGMRYYLHAQTKAREKKLRLEKAIRRPPSMEASSMRDAIPGFDKLTQASAVAGGQIWLVWVSVSFPVIYTLIGAIVGFVMGIVVGALLAGVFLFANFQVTTVVEIVIGICLSAIILIFQVAPRSINRIFL